MKCWSEQHINRFLDGEMGEPEQARLREHLTHCASCTQLLEGCRREAVELRQTLAATLPDEFTANLMEQLAQLPPPSVDASKKRRAKFRLNRRTALLATVAMVLLVALSSLVVPTFADYIKFFFTSRNADYGMRTSADQGLTHAVNQQVTDQGYTLHTLDLIADPTRMILTFEILNPKRQPQKDILGLAAPNQIAVEDASGKKIGDMRDIGRDNTLYVVEFDPNQELPDHLQIAIDLHHLGQFQQKGIDGHWALTLPVDLTKTKALTKVYPINRSYTTPEGVQVEIKRFVESPSGARLDIDSSLTASAKQKVPEEYWTDYNLMYHFLRNGQEFTSVNSTKIPHSENLTGRNPKVVDPNTGVVHWFFTFTPFPDAKSLDFVFDGVNQTVMGNHATLTFDPARVAKRPQMFAYGQTNIKLYGFQIDTDEETHQPVAALKVSGVMEDESIQNVWTATDDQGHSFPVYLRGALTILDNGNGQIQSGTEFRIYGLTQQPKQLTLTLDHFGHRYTDVHWQVPLLAQTHS